ncbi:Tim44 domain-containing protein [Skermanella pratensis]|uniref:Tim44 domain-containing protein n=1 Tax=Skermanella pratensis TaxID=2233999 RepID=UPI0013013D7B|nr:Tim44 domain-containing protein [Skermanella pratensis]
MTQNRKPRRTQALIALAAVLTLVATSVDARPGRNSNLGSRGARTYEAPAPTNTAPRTAAPMERSATDRPTAGQPGAAAGLQRPAAPANRGFFGGLAGGLLGAGLTGMLLGGGFFGGLGGFASILGFLLQVALIGGLIWLAIRFFRSRNQPAYAGAGNSGGRGPSGQGPLNRNAAPGGYARTGAGLGGGAARATAKTPKGVDGIGIGPADYEAFERLLRDIQTGYGREDRAALRSLTTPEVASYFTEELDANAARGVVNRIEDVSLLQGDLSEAWREGAVDYATVAMRYSLVDYTVDRAGDSVVDGDRTKPTEAVEVWTFQRPAGGGWVLSAIQQA